MGNCLFSIVAEIILIVVLVMLGNVIGDFGFWVSIFLGLLIFISIIIEYKISESEGQ